VQGWDRNEVEIHAVKTAKVKESDLERVAIDVEAKPAATTPAGQRQALAPRLGVARPPMGSLNRHRSGRFGRGQHLDL